ncbi:MAG: peptide-methionine (R)-S-oxide reductase MsrB [Cytophagales bacterium]|nr:peptide-methionine (R)-S-oxide reductase MsrB [Cytophagales bacterium]
MELSEKDWREKLTSEQYRVLREKGTERPGRSPFLLNEEKGIYQCAGCGNDLFSSDTKFDSGCGWPSFYETINSNAVVHTRDTAHGMIRTEITCAKCDGHLGHVFPDGPEPTGNRFCMNGVSLEFKKA